VDDAFGLDPEALKKAWNPNCRVLVLNMPCNPTGGITPVDRLGQIARFAVEKDLLVISDEIYSELTYDERQPSIATLPGMRDRTIFLHGFSKAFAMTGFRVGYACAPPELIEAMMKVHQYSMMCAPILSQEAALEALNHGEDAVVRMREQYRRRRDLMVRRLREAGLGCHLPGGSFYVFPDIRATGLDDQAFAVALLNQQKVAAVPGRAFGPDGQGFVRCSYATAYDQLIEACDRIERFVAEAVNPSGSGHRAQAVSTEN
jgi:aminotransferase